jgi:hypothetical protein
VNEEICSLEVVVADPFVVDELQGFNERARHFLEYLHLLLIISLVLKQTFWALVGKGRHNDVESVVVPIRNDVFDDMTMPTAPLHDFHLF